MLLFFLAALTAGLVCIALHYEALRLLAGWVAQMRGAPRRRLLFVMIGSLFSHMLHVGLFAAALWAAAAMSSPGLLGALPDRTIWEALSLSIESYAALGSPDIGHIGSVRLFCGVESLVGLLLIGWSSAFTYWSMRRFWRFHPRRIRPG